MNTVEHYVCQHSVAIPDRMAVVTESERLTYRELWDAIEERSRQLRSSGGCANIIRTSHSSQFLVEYLASHHADMVAVPLSDDIPDPEYRSIADTLAVADIPAHTADILFTTGTTGKQKGTMISHRAIVANAENLIAAQGFSRNTLFVVAGPLNHIGSLSKVWPVLIQGGCLYITHGMKDLNAFFHPFSETFCLSLPCGSAYRLATFLVPASIRMLLQLAQSQLARYADVIDFIETGAAPISQTDMAALCAILPHTRLYNTYASTETGIIATHNYNSDHCVAGCLGLPMPHSQVYITPDGNVACKGDTLMSGYIADPSLTATVFHDNTVFTSDRGEIDSQGRLVLTGRDGDVINVGGYKVNPVEVEQAALSHPDVHDCVCIAADHKVLGTVLQLLVVPATGSSLRPRDLAQHILLSLERYKVPQLYRQVDHIERTFNGKINRKAYR